MKLRKTKSSPETDMQKARIDWYKQGRKDRLNTAIDYAPKTKPSEIKPYDWAEEPEAFFDKTRTSVPADGSRLVRIGSTTDTASAELQPRLTQEGHLKRCLEVFKYTAVLASTFVEVLREGYLPKDPFQEARRASEEDGVSTVIYMKWDN